MRSISSRLERLERELATPRQIAVQRMHHLGFPPGGARPGGLPLRLASLLREAFGHWSLFLDAALSASRGAPPAPVPRACESDGVGLLRRTIGLLSETARLDPTLGEEVARAGGSQSTCSKLIDQIAECASVLDASSSSDRRPEDENGAVEREEDSDALVDLQDAVFGIYSPSAKGRGMAFTLEELEGRLPLVYDLAPAPSSRRRRRDSPPGENEDGATASIFINQVTKRRQSAQADVGFVMWPSAIVLSRWLISNPNVIKGKSVLELGAGCGLVGIAAARIILLQQQEEEEVQSNSNGRELDESNALEEATVIITDVNELVLENILQNINLNDIASVASVAKLDFYLQSGENRSGRWIAGCDRGREPVDVILAADVICQPEDAIAASKTIYDALKPGGAAFVVCANAEHRFGVEIFADECEGRGLKVLATDVAEMYEGELLSEGVMHSAAGYVDGMTLTFFKISKKDGEEM